MRQYQRLFDMDGVRLTFEDEALREIAQKALARETGARGLRSIMETLLLPTMFAIPEDEETGEVIITGACARGEAEPTLLTHEEVAKRDKKSA